ncbi:MAG: Holliday junction resolvase RuvX [candidate division Zixibacteria bacterium]|nr:Holliday junction resolvase RuvX [candidate division Zixibacteria bacterium]
MPRRNRRMEQVERQPERRAKREIRGHTFEIPDTLAMGWTPPVRTDTPGRVVGVDFGLKRLGVSVSDPEGRIAQGLETVDVGSPDDAPARIAGIAERYGARCIVVGLPRHMNGNEGDMALRVRMFAQTLERLSGVPVHTWDERLTSREAERVLAETGVRIKNDKKQVDRTAAILLLQGFLDRRRYGYSADADGKEEEETCRS